ncbi:unnamed protein product [Closterium sp. NIES-54]
MDECAIVYLDDILIYSKNMKEHAEHLRKVFKILRKNKFYMNRSRSDFALKNVRFLGQMDTPYEWDTPQQQAMEQLQTALTTAPILILPDPDTDYVVEADASDQVVRANLMHDHGHGLQPIAYLSKKLHGAELIYPIHDKEALAIVTTFKTWSHGKSLASTSSLVPSTSRGHDAKLVVIDKFSKMGHFILSNAMATTEASARLFFYRIITIHGIPATLISDMDPKS